MHYIIRTEAIHPLGVLQGGVDRWTSISYLRFVVVLCISLSLFIYVYCFFVILDLKQNTYIHS